MRAKSDEVQWSQRVRVAEQPLRGVEDDVRGRLRLRPVRARVNEVVRSGWPPACGVGARRRERVDLHARLGRRPRAEARSGRGSDRRRCRRSHRRSDARPPSSRSPLLVAGLLGCATLACASCCTHLPLLLDEARPCSGVAPALQSGCRRCRRARSDVGGAGGLRCPGRGTRRRPRTAAAAGRGRSRRLRGRRRSSSRLRSGPRGASCLAGEEVGVLAVARDREQARVEWARPRGDQVDFAVLPLVGVLVAVGVAEDERLARVEEDPPVGGQAVAVRREPASLVACELVGAQEAQIDRRRPRRRSGRPRGGRTNRSW